MTTTITVEGRDIQELKRFQSALDTLRDVKVFHAIHKPIKEVYKPKHRSGKTKVITDSAEIFFTIIGERAAEKFINLHHMKQAKVWRMWVANQNRAQVLFWIDTL